MDRRFSIFAIGETGREFGPGDVRALIHLIDTGDSEIGA